MEISTQEINQIELITVQGRVDSVEAVRLARALESAQQRGMFRIVVDMSQLEYMSSAGFRALGDAQRTSHRNRRGDVVLAAVPAPVYEALELVGFTEYFRIEKTVASAMALIENSPPSESSSTS